MVLSHLDNAPEPFLRAHSLSILTFCRMYLGDLPKASQTLLLLREFLRSREASLISRIRNREAEIVYKMFTGSLEEGLKAASESLELSEATGARVAPARILGNKAFILMIQRDFKGARGVLEQMTPLLGIMNPVDISFYQMISARLSQFLGDFVDGLFHADLVLRKALEANYIRWQLPSLISKAHILHQMGKKEESQNHIAKALEMAQKVQSRFWEFVATLVSALFSLEQGNEKKAIQQLRWGMAMGRKAGFFMLLCVHPMDCHAL